MEYTSEQLNYIIVNQLTDSERSGMLCYVIGYLNDEDCPPQFVEALNSCLKHDIFIKSKITV